MPSARTSIFFTLALLLCACTFGKPEPPQLVTDRTACTKCKMLISDQRFAAAYQADDALPFDDIGCMLASVHSLPKEPEYIWVRDFEGKSWLDARTAVYVEAREAGTPMNYGFVALGDAGKAATIASQLHGKVIGNWSALVIRFKEGT